MGSSHDACRVIAAPLVLLFSLCLPSAASAQESTEVVGAVYLPVKVRDFLEAHQGAAWRPEPMTPVPGGHPDFTPVAEAAAPQRGAIEPWIDTLGAKSSFEGDHRNPKLIVPMVTKGYTGLKEFNAWFNDRDSTVNRSYLVYLKFDVREDCILSYNSDAFFPIDDGKVFYPLDIPPRHTFGHRQPVWPQHNFGFTLEFHTSFTYVKGGGQRFRFSGDDDVWVFINDSLVIDLGGIHSEESAEVLLDDFPPGFFRDGKKYPFDLFFAERQPTGSHLRIETSILFDLGFKDLVAVKARRAADAIISCYGKYVEVPDEEPPSPPAVSASAGHGRQGKPVVRTTVTAGGITVTIEGAGASAVTGIHLYTLDGSEKRLEQVTGRVEDERAVWAGTVADVSSGAYVLQVRSGARRLNTEVVAFR
jgi:fibro-slime domain-containing protein